MQAMEALKLLSRFQDQVDVILGLNLKESLEIADVLGLPGRTDAEALNPPLAWSVPYGLNLSVRVKMPGAISAIEVPSHPTSIQLGDGGATVTLAQPEAALDRDFVLSIAACGGRANTAATSC